MHRLFYTTALMLAAAALAGCGKKADIQSAATMTGTSSGTASGTSSGTASGTATGTATGSTSTTPNGNGGAVTVYGGSASLIRSCEVRLDRSLIAPGASAFLTVIGDNSIFLSATIYVEGGAVRGITNVTPNGMSVSPAITTYYGATVDGLTCRGATLSVVTGPQPISCVDRNGLINPLCSKTVLLPGRPVTTDKPGTMNLNRLCSIAARPAPEETFTEALYPILALETDASPRILLETIDLRSYRISSADLRLKIVRATRNVPFKLDVDPLISLLAWYGFPQGSHLNRWITARVCDDRDRDGSCYLEPAKYQLSEQAVTFQPGEFRGSYGIDVWAGREPRYLDAAKKKVNPKFASTCDTQESPLVIDLANDGIQLGGEGTARFNHSGAGEVASGWPTGADDALLVRLPNGGTSLTGANLFGNHTRLPNGAAAENGFHALAQFDTHDRQGRNVPDGLITKEDAVWKTLRVWQDRAPYGRATAAELKTLDATGIETIQISYVPMKELDVHGNRTLQRSSVIVKGKGPVTIADVWFATE